MRHLFLAIALFALPSVTRAIEEPDYAVLRKLGEVEVRFYAPYVVAQVFVAGTENMADDMAEDKGVPVLAEYLFGKNRGEKQASWPAPITPGAVSTRLEMTAPVTRISAAGGYMVRFVLPKRVSLESAPEPIDGRVQLRAIPERRLAAITFSGFWSEANYAEHLDKLKAALRAADLSWSGEPVYARYNPPMTPWFMRRNEIWLALR